MKGLITLFWFSLCTYSLQGEDELGWKRQKTGEEYSTAAMLRRITARKATTTLEVTPWEAVYDLMLWYKSKDWMIRTKSDVAVKVKYGNAEDQRTIERQMSKEDWEKEVPDYVRDLTWDYGFLMPTSFDSRIPKEEWHYLKEYVKECMGRYFAPFGELDDISFSETGNSLEISVTGKAPRPGKLEECARILIKSIKAPEMVIKYKREVVRDPMVPRIEYLYNMASISDPPIQIRKEFVKDKEVNLPAVWSKMLETVSVELRIDLDSKSLKVDDDYYFIASHSAEITPKYLQGSIMARRWELALWKGLHNQVTISLERVVRLRKLSSGQWNVLKLEGYSQPLHAQGAPRPQDIHDPNMIWDRIIQEIIVTKAPDK